MVRPAAAGVEEEPWPLMAIAAPTPAPAATTASRIHFLLMPLCAAVPPVDEVSVTETLGAALEALCAGGCRAAEVAPVWVTEVAGIAGVPGTRGVASAATDCVAGGGIAGDVCVAGVIGASNGATTVP